MKVVPFSASVSMRVTNVWTAICTRLSRSDRNVAPARRKRVEGIKRRGGSLGEVGMEVVQEERSGDAEKQLRRPIECRR
jgi:hypothetical protein